MIKQIRTTLLTGLLFLGMLTCLHAQDKSENTQKKHEYSTVTYIPELKKIVISVSGKETKEIEISNKEYNGNQFDTSLALYQIDILNAKGWELFDTAVTGYGRYNAPMYIFSLKKK